MLKRSLNHVFAVYLLCLAALPAQGFAQDGPAFRVDSANSQLNGSVYFFNAVFDIRLPHYIVTAIEQGFNLPLMMEIEAYQRSPLWFDERVVYIKQQYRINYHALLDEFSIFNINSGMRSYYTSLERAIASLSVLIEFPGVDNNSLKMGEDYRVRIRLGIDTEELPLPLQSSSLWQNDWNLQSEWYEWELRP